MPLRPTKNFLYEPRAFWSVARLDSGNFPATRPPNVLRLPRADFLNGEKYPVTLRQLCFAPINYIFDRYSDGNPLSTANFRDDGVAAMERAQFVISAPQRQYYLKRAGVSQFATPRPSYTPAAAGQNGLPDYVSSLWGMTRWQFDHAMLIPKLGDLEFDLSTWNADGSFPPETGVQLQLAYIHFEETKAGLFNGQGRNSGVIELRPYSSPNANLAPLYPPDGFGNFNAGAGDPTLNGIWLPSQRFTAKRYGAENATSDGSIPVTAFAVMIDQINGDQQVAEQHVPAFNAGSTVTPLACRVGTRARMRNGGTGSYWWRPGAPLALVSPTITPAQVYDLPEPITLGPGDSLEIEMTVPLPAIVVGQPIGSIYQVGVSLCGYAAIEA